MSDDPATIREQLGRLIAFSERAVADRAELKGELHDGLDTVHRRLDALAALPDRVKALEDKDDERHAQNLQRMDRTETRVDNIEKALATSAGAKAAVKYLLGVLLTLLAAIGGYFKWGR